jgi:hypothetical protein
VLDGPGWLPVPMVLANAIRTVAACPGFSRVPGHDRAVDFDPVTLFAGSRLLVRLATPRPCSVAAGDQPLGLAHASART